MKSGFEIAGRPVGIGRPCYVIAEAGVNHNCDLALGRALVDTAKACGADAIKFQSYTAGRIATRVAPRYWVEANDPATLFAVAMLFIGVALLACWPPTRRATRVDPMKTLRCE